MPGTVLETGNSVENKILALLGLTFSWERQMVNNYTKLMKVISDTDEYREVNNIENAKEGL